MPTEPGARPARRRRRDAAVIGIGLLAGIGVSAFGDDVRDLVGGSAGQDPAAVALPASDADFARLEPVSADASATPGAPAASPAEAVEQFLDAEVAGDHARSFALLDRAGRQAYGSAAGWRAAHASFFPITGFELAGVNDAGGATEVVTSIRYRASLDEVVGLVPAAAEVAWPVVEEEGGWLVDFDGAEVTPEVLPDAGAPAAARAWASARRACKDAPEYSAGLVGAATLADRLCGAEGRILVGPVASLDPGEAAPFVSAFGAPAATWARTVRLSGPVDLTVVLAPVADRWLVVGVVAPR